MVDVTHEEQMGKLFGSTKGELAIYGQLLAQYHATLQDWGVVPRSGQEVTVRFGLEEKEEAPVMLMDVFEEHDVEVAAEFGRLVATKARLANPQPNGHHE